MKASINNASIIKFYAPVGTDAKAYLEVAKRIGGATIYRARGIWWSEQGELFDEECEVIEIVHPCSKAELLLHLAEEACEKFLADNPKELATLAVLQGADGVKSATISRASKRSATISRASKQSLVLRSFAELRQASQQSRNNPTKTKEKIMFDYPKLNEALSLRLKQLLRQ